MLQRRAWVAVPIVLFMLWGPFNRHALGGESPWLHAWAMYHQSFSRLCSARYMHRAADGTERELEHAKLLAYRRPKLQGAELYRTRNKAHAVHTARRLCAVVEPRDVRLYAECGDMTEGWVDVAQGEQNICEQVRELK